MRVRRWDHEGRNLECTLSNEHEGSNICRRRTQGRNRRARKANEEQVRGWRRAGEGRHRTQRVQEGGTRTEKGCKTEGDTQGGTGRTGGRKDHKALGRCHRGVQAPEILR